MTRNEKPDKLIEAAERITQEFQNKGFPPSDAIYVLFVSFMNVSLCSGTPIICLFQMEEYLNKWKNTLYDASNLTDLEDIIFNRLIKDFDIRKFSEGRNDL